ncbi:MAG: DUF3105 domain-containing protein [Pseudonocardiales bacterium]
MEYPTAPSSSGPHYPARASPQVWFYAPGTTPPVEVLVHNLEHGYTVIWYHAALRGRQLDDLGRLANTLGQHPGKVIVTAWDAGHGHFPPRQHVAMAHWSAKAEHREYCRGVSTPAIEAFVKSYPNTDALEPGGR